MSRCRRDGRSGPERTLLRGWAERGLSGGRSPEDLLGAGGGGGADDPLPEPFGVGAGGDESAVPLGEVDPPCTQYGQQRLGFAFALPSPVVPAGELGLELVGPGAHQG